MSYRALVEFLADADELPVSVNTVLDWIEQNTDHKSINLHGVAREHKAFRGAFRRRAAPTLTPYATDQEIWTDVLYGKDLPEEWKRLVIVKEVLHVFDGEPERVHTPDAVHRLILSVIHRDIPPTFPPAVNDHFGAFRAMAVLLPRNARRRLKAAQEQNNGVPTTQEIARYCQVPVFYVDVWMQMGDVFEGLMFN